MPPENQNLMGSEPKSSNKTALWIVLLVIALALVLWFLLAARRPGREVSAPPRASTQPITAEERQRILESLTPPAGESRPVSERERSQILESLTPAPAGAPSREISAEERARILESLQSR